MQEQLMADLPRVPIGAETSNLVGSKSITGWLGDIYDLVYWSNLRG